MARRPTHRMRLPNRPDEPAAGTFEDAASPTDAAIQGSGNEPQTASAGRKTGRTSRQAEVIQSGGVASRRVAAAAAAAGAAVAKLPSGVEASTSVSPAVANAPAEPVGSAVDPVSAAEIGPKPDFEVASVSAAGVAAASAVNAAIAATFAARASHAGPSANPDSQAAVSATAPIPPVSNPALPAVPARPPVTVQGYRRSPAKDSPSIIRAHRDEPEDADAAVTPDPTAADDPNRRYMRRSEPEAVAPAPLFSNEGIVRQVEAERRSRFLGPLGGLVAAFQGAGKAFGHTDGSSGSETETLAVTAESDAFVGSSPDFLPNGNPRRSRKRKSAAMFAAATLIAALFVVAGGAAFLPTEKGPVATATPGSSPTLPGIAVLDKSLAPNDGPAGTPTAGDPTAPPSGLVIGDDPLPPGATRKPVAKATASATTAGPGPTATHSATPGTSPTPSQTTTPTPVPTPTPTPTPVPTPTPTPVLSALLYSATPPAVSPGDGTFYVYSLPGASCNLYAYLTPNMPPSMNYWKKSATFTTHPAAASDAGWAYIAWGHTWGPTWPANETTITFSARCTMPPSPASVWSDPVSVIWPAHSSPTPTPT